jgi:hypothetical protein
MAGDMNARHVAAALVLATAVGTGVAGVAQAAPRTFRDCTAMHAVFRYGVAGSARAAAHPFPFWIRIRTPLIDGATYAANKKLDRDGDGIACEVAR